MGRDWVCGSRSACDGASPAFAPAAIAALPRLGGLPADVVDVGRRRWPFMAGDWRTACAVVTLPLVLSAVEVGLRFDFLAGGVV